MDVEGALGIALSVMAIALAAAGLYAVSVVVSAVREIRESVEEVRVRVVPLLDKADVTVDAINAELLRLDAIVTQAEEVGGVVSTASDFIRSPVSSAAQGIAKIARSFGKR